MKIIDWKKPQTGSILFMMRDKSYLVKMHNKEIAIVTRKMMKQKFYGKPRFEIEDGNRQA